tara:strand:- start:450 stop:2195 length:1746 start_codon:yes stop_codon:yes gene_type:complete
MSFNVTLDLKPELLDGEKDPVVHLWVTNCKKHNNDYKCVSKMGKSSHKVKVGRFSDELVLSCDYYVKIQSKAGLWCKMHKGRVTCPIEKSASTYEFVNQNTNSPCGEVTISCDAQFKPYNINMQELSEHIGSMIDSDYAIFNNLAPSCGFIGRVHAPKWNTRTVSLPGQAYFYDLEKTLVTSDGFFRNLLNSVLKRRNMKMADVNKVIEKQFSSHNTDDTVSKEFHLVCSAVAEMCELPVTYYPYVQDMYCAKTGAKKGSRHKSFESFDDLFQRASGDCEDMARAMMQVHSCLQEANFTTTDLKNIQRVAKLYVPAATLAMVTGPQHGDDGGHAAHMYVRFFPKTTFFNKAGFPLDNPAKWTTNLHTWLGEGTAPVEPTTGLEAMKELTTPEKSAYEMKNRVNKISHMSRVCRPGWSVQRDKFYQQDVLCLTDALMKAGVARTGAFSFVQGKTYGVDVETVNSNGNYQLYPHPDLTDDDHELIKEVMQFEHPPMKLKVQHDVLENKHVKKLLRICSMYKDKAKSALYDDHYLQRPNERTPEELETIAAEIQASGAYRVEVNREGWDDMSHVLRFRLFGVHN